MVGRVVWGWVGVKLKPALLSAVGIHSSHSQKCAVWPKYSAGSTSQATCLLKAMAKPAEGYAFGLKSPKTEKKYFEMHYTSKLRVIVRSSLENISHAVHSATGPQSTKLWCSNAISNWKKGTKGGRKKGGGLLRDCDSEQAADLGKQLIASPPIGSAWLKPPAIALHTTAARGGEYKADI